MGELQVTTNVPILNFSAIQNTTMDSMESCFPLHRDEYALKMLELFHDPEVRAVAEWILTFFRDLPASIFDHHQGRYGLLYHTVNCVDRFMEMHPMPPSSRRDRILLSIVGHDVGKAFMYTGLVKGKPHQEISYELLKEKVRDEDVLRAVKKHHSGTSELTPLIEADRASCRDWADNVSVPVLLNTSLGVGARLNKAFICLQKGEQAHYFLNIYCLLYYIRRILSASNGFFETTTLYNVMDMKALGGHTQLEAGRLTRYSLGSYVHEKVKPYFFACKVLVRPEIDGLSKWLLPLNDSLAQKVRWTTHCVDSCTVKWGTGFSSSLPFERTAPSPADAMGTSSGGGSAAQAVKTPPAEKSFDTPRVEIPKATKDKISRRIRDKGKKGGRGGLSFF